MVCCYLYLALKLKTGITAIDPDMLSQKKAKTAYALSWH